MTDSREHLPVGWKSLPSPFVAEAGIRRDEQGLVLIPYRRLDGSTHNRQVVAPSGRVWWERAGLRLMIFGAETLADDAARRALFVCEGAPDCLAMRAAYGEIEPTKEIEGYDAIAVPGANTWRSVYDVPLPAELDWRPLIRQYGIVYAMGDGDPAGRELNWQIKCDIPGTRPVAIPDGEDCRSLLQQDGQAALDALLDDADRWARVNNAFSSAATYAEWLSLARGGEAADAA